MLQSRMETDPNASLLMKYTVYIAVQLFVTFLSSPSSVCDFSRNHYIFITFGRGYYIFKITKVLFGW